MMDATLCEKDEEPSGGPGIYKKVKKDPTPEIERKVLQEVGDWK